MPTVKQKKSRKKKFIAELHTTMRLSYDPESPLFKETLAAYRRIVDPNADEQNMLCHVVHNLDLNGHHSSMIEGVGYVSYKGEYPRLIKEDLKSGIDLSEAIDKPDIDIISNDYI